jgi:hypothetical protein
MRTAFLLAKVSFLFLGFSEGHAYLHALHEMEALLFSDAPIKITINPEARVSVSRSGELPPPPACGTAVELPVTIINQAFVTAPLEATPVGNSPPNIRLEFPSDPLKGIPEETRILRVTIPGPEPTDVTISFRARNDIPDLGGRDRIHLLLRCHWDHS